MSLETVLHIGKKLRETKDNLRYFKASELCPKNKDGIYPICFNIPVKNDFTFDWDNIGLVPENKQSQLYYLKFKTSGNDSSVKYIFGDIFFEKVTTISKTGNIEIKYGGYYKLGNPYNSSNSLERGQTDFESIEKEFKQDSVIKKFRESFKSDINKIESLLLHALLINHHIIEVGNEEISEILLNTESLKKRTVDLVLKELTKVASKKIGIEDLESLSERDKQKLYNYSSGSVFLHFEFEGGKQWYEFEDEFKAIKSKILSEFVENTSYGKVLKKTLYKTLCSGDDKNDIQFPKFTNKNKHKVKSFNDDSLEDLFYAIDFTSKGRFIKGTDIKRIVLPLGENLQAEDYIDFLQNKDEGQVLNKNMAIEEPLFSFLEDTKSSITSFDLIFCKKGAGVGTPDTDLIEISGIEKSKLQMTMKRIGDISSSLMAERKTYLKTKKDLFDFKIENSFQNILGTPQYDEKTKKVSIKVNPKYESHLLKVLPKIYTDTYTHDEILLPAFIQNVEYSVRSGDEKFTFLQFDLKFLYKIQNSNNEKFTDMISSESYQIGLLLGSLSKNLTLEINSFEKNYVGTLLRRIGNLSDFIKMKNDVEQKLIMHDKTKYTFQISYDLAQKVKEFNGFYDKEECAFGFFESYFKPIVKKENQE
jgi:hypothetical protein